MPPANSPSDTPSLSPYRPDSLPASTSDLNRTQPAPSEALLIPPLSQSETNRARPGTNLHSPPQFRPQRHSQDPPGSDGRYRRFGLNRPRRSSRDPDSRPHRDQAYGPRIPLMRPGQRQSVYDWAPAYLGDDLESRALPPILHRAALDEETPRELPFSQRSVGGAREPPPFRYTDIPGAPHDSTFRMAVMQSLRNNNPRRSQRSRSHWQDWLSERDSAGREVQEEPAIRPRLEWRDSDVNARMQHQRLRETLSRFSGLPAASYEVEEAIEYLATVRFCNSPEESLRLAARGGFNNGEDWVDLLDEHPRCEDFILDTQFLSAAETSWLKVGGIFWGSQTSNQRPGGHSTSSTSSLPPNAAQRIPSVDGGNRWNPSRGTSDYETKMNRWTVKVSISSVDYLQMQLTGTMEAFPEWQTGSINTYLEGEIIDFNKYSFKTSSFGSTVKIDADNWRRLDPFVHMSNDTLVKGLVSRNFMKELTDKWVFMRWKEKCFISPQSETSAGELTIGGFYFLSMRREDGHIQGYYYDPNPNSQPFQELVLKPQKRLFPTYEFR